MRSNQNHQIIGAGLLSCFILKTVLLSLFFQPSIAVPLYWLINPLDPNYFHKNGVLVETKMRMLIREMYLHGWKNYLKYANNFDDLSPISCTGRSTILGNYLTLIDAADGLALIGAEDEFRDAVNRISEIKDFNFDKSVSVFETTIRYLGGLLSTHVLAKKHLPDYKDALLSLAVDLGDRLIRAFNSPTGVNYNSVNLRHGLKGYENSQTCIACGALLMEFGYLSYLTGNSTYFELSKKSMVTIWNRRTPIDLLGKSINVKYGDFQQYASIGAESDSYYEYLLKSYVLFHDNDLLLMFDQAYAALEKYSSMGAGHAQVDIYSGSQVTSTFQALECFWAGLQGSIGDVDEGFEMVKFMGLINTKYAFFPEIVSYPEGLILNPSYILRPELVETLYYFHRTTKNPGFREFAFEILNRFHLNTRTTCGFTSIEDVETMKKEDHMESFFLAETLKYLYLLFDDDNEVHQRGMVFTTEAHPLPIPSNHKRLLKNTFVNASMTATGKNTVLIQQCSAKKWKNFMTKLSFASSISGYNFLQKS